jgi:hypothetical protein
MWTSTQKFSFTEQIGLEITSQTWTQYVLGSNLCLLMTILTEGFRALPQSLHTNPGMVPRIGHGHFFPFAFFIISHSTIRPYIVATPKTSFNKKENSRVLHSPPYSFNIGLSPCTGYSSRMLWLKHLRDYVIAWVGNLTEEKSRVYNEEIRSGILLMITQ